jgi:hypothetical protein
MRCALLLTLGCCSHAVFASIEFHPRAAVSGTWTDNIDLLPDNNPGKKSEYVIQANPGFTLEEKAPHFNTSLEYTMQNLFFLQDSERNSTFHQGMAHVLGELMKNYFFVEANGSYSQQIIDPMRPTSNGNLFDTHNQTDALAVNVTPFLRHDFDNVRLDARYSRGRVNYKKTPTTGLLQDANTDSRTVSLSTVDDEAPLTWLGKYESQRAEYEFSPEFRYDQATAELGIGMGKSLRLIGRGGSETDLTTNTSQGGLDHTWWEAGLRWHPGIRTTAEGFYGRRFYGPSYSAHLVHEARHATWTISYSEMPYTQAQEFMTQPVAFDPRAQGTFAPGSEDFHRATSDVFIRKTADATVHIFGQRTDIELRAMDYRREYLTGTLGGEHRQGGSLQFTRKLSDRSSWFANGGIDDSKLQAGDHYQETFYGLGWHRRLGDKISASLSGQRRRRIGNLEFVANWVTLAFSGEF